MKWFRQTLKKHRITFLTLLAVNVFFMVDGTQCLHARELKQHERNLFLGSFSQTFDLPAERLLPAEPSALDRAAGFYRDRLAPWAAEGTSRLEALIGELGEELEASAALFEGAKVHAASPQDPAGAGAASAERDEPRAALPSQPLPPAGEKLAAASARPREEAPRLQRVERKARTVKGTAALAAKSSAVAPASVPRQVIPKSGIAPEITALAESLGNSPGRIFRFVHDTIDFDPKWGAQKSALGTLQEGRGTSWDQAWLLQEVLTAAGVDARFEWGEVQIPTETLLEMAGVADAFRAGDLLTTAGTPIVLVVEGSRVVHARMSHAWVKAHLDYVPNRGATAGPGDTWIRMDPSLKRFEITAGLRLDEAVPYDLGAYLSSGTEASPRASYEEALGGQIADQNLGVALDEVKPGKTVVEEAFPFVPGTLRAKILSVAGEATAVPAAFQQQLELQVREAGGATLLTWSTAWPAVYGQRLELAWPGATSADEATLDLYGGVFAAPPYEVDLKPVLRLEGVEVATGGAIGSAEDAVLVATLTPPSGPATVVPFDLRAGEHAVFAVDFGRTPQETIDRYAAEQAGATDEAEIEAWGLAHAGAVYQRALAADVEHLAGLRGLRRVQLGNVTLAVQRGGVSEAPDGTPLTFSPAPPAVDLGSMTLGLFPADGVAASPAASVATLELLGSQGSFLEGEALAAALGGEHLTSVTALTRAVREGQTLTRVDAANVDAALAAADLGDDAETSVAAGVGGGKIAWIHESQLLHQTWDAAGYVLEDPATGAGGYFVTYERLLEPLDATITFHSPVDLDEVTQPTDVVASIEGDEIGTWTLSYKAADGGEAVVLASGSGPVAHQTLAQFDPTLLLNGLYEIVLTARNAIGQTASEKISVVVDGNMKIGHFTLSFLDLAVPVSGLDIEIVRTYDSRDPQERDFGVGWSLDIRRGSYRNNRLPGEGWQFQTGFLPCDTVVESKSHWTIIRLSDQDVYRFALNLVDGTSTGGGCFATARFDFLDGPLPGATLEILGNDQVFYENGGDRVIDAETFALYEPEDVRLTTRDGRIFELDLNDGVTRLEDLNGNHLSITSAGVTHSSGRGIVFDRDAEGRITRITDPLGRIMTYAYDAAGDLASYTNRAGATTRFTYDGSHRLLDIEDPRGVTSTRNEYDAEGRLVRHIDASGRVIELGHDRDNRREIVTNRLGASRVLEYDARGNVVRETDELGNVTTFTYDGRDNVLSETDALGRTTTYTYTSNDDVATLTDPLGNTTALTSNSRGQVISVTDPRGGVTTHAYDARGNLTRTTDALGGVTAFSYDARGNRLSITDALGNVSSFQFDAFGNQTRETDPLGNATVWTYDAAGNRLTETRNRTLPDGSSESLVTSFAYDDLDQLTTTTAPDGSATSVTYDVFGKVTQHTDALGRLTTMTYDLTGRLVSTAYPDGTSEVLSYDDEGRMVGQTDRAGRTKTFVYDAAGRLTTTTFPDGTSTSSLYDAADQEIATTDARGNTTRFEYDAAGQVTAIIDALGNGPTLAYDAGGNQTSMTDARGNSTTVAYDALNRPSTTTYPDGTTTSSLFDALGRRIAETDQAGLTTRAVYDALGRLIRVEDALEQVTSYTYDEIGDRLTQTDANGHTTSFEYDGLRRRTARILPDGSRESMAYNADGTLASHTDFRGVTRTFEYDADGRLTRRTYPDGSDVTFTYTASGQRATVTDVRGTTTYTYDSRDRLTEKTDPTGYTLSYAYDAQGNRTQLTATVGAEVLTTSYTHDALNRPATVTDGQGGITTLGYDLDGNRASLAHPNGVTTSYTYDALSRLTDLSTATSIGSVLASYAYTLGPTGNRTRIGEHDGTSRHYAYDDLHRLTQDRVTDPAGALVYQRDFTYDPVGNRLQQTIDESGSPTVITSSYDTRDRLLAAAATSYGWDANGNLTSETGGVGAAFEWDFEDQLISVTLDDGTVVETTYDADGNRVRTAVTPSGGSTMLVDYLVDTAGFLSHVVAEVVAGSVETVYTRVDDQLIGLYRPATGTSRYLHADGLGSVRALSDETGAITDRYSYTAFGEPLLHSGTDPQPYRFAGEPFDPDSGLHYNRARWLDVSSGRFIGMDPFSGRVHDPRSLHRYLYAHLNPTLALDPTGRETLVGKTVSAAVQTTISAIKAGKTLGYIWMTQATALVAGGMTFLIYRGPQVLQLLRGTGHLGVRALQRIHLQTHTIVTRAQALQSANWASYSRMRPALNRIITNGTKNPEGIQWHHLVEQQAARFLGPNAIRAINSMANIVPTPVKVHRAISGFYSSKPDWVAKQGYPTFRAWVSQKSWEEQYRIGLEIWKRAMTTGKATYHP